MLLFLGVRGPSNKFRNVYILKDQMRVVWCINCHQEVGVYDKSRKFVVLKKVEVRKVALVEYRTQCVLHKLGGRHAHRYRIWQAVAGVRKNLDVKRTFYGSRGRVTNEVCPLASSQCLIGIDEEEVSNFNLNIGSGQLICCFVSPI